MAGQRCSRTCRGPILASPLAQARMWRWNPPMWCWVRSDPRDVAAILGPVPRNLREDSAEPDLGDRFTNRGCHPHGGRHHLRHRLHDDAPPFGAGLMSASTIIVAINAQLLRFYRRKGLSLPTFPAKHMLTLSSSQFDRNRTFARPKAGNCGILRQNAMGDGSMKRRTLKWHTCCSWLSVPSCSSPGFHDSTKMARHPHLLGAARPRRRG